MATDHRGPVPLVQVPATEIDASWIGEQLLVTHIAGTCTHAGTLSDLEQVTLFDRRSSTVFGALALYVGGDVVVITDPERDVIVAAPTPTALDLEPDIASSPYDQHPTSQGEI